MNRPWIIRGIKITWSALFSVAVVLLIVLWARSYHRNDVVFNVGKNLVQTSYGSNAGTVYLFRSTAFRGNPTGIKTTLSGGKYSVATIQQTSGWKYLSAEAAKRKSMFDWRLTGTTTIIQIPIWLLVIPLAVAGATPWLRFRFTLRTLLIATTLVAMVLGLIAWTAR